MPTRTTPRKTGRRPVRKRQARITDPFYRRMIANPERKIPFLLA